MNANPRSLKRSRQQKLLVAETVNKQSIDQLIAMINEFMDKLVTVQREVLVLRSALIDRRVISEMELEQVRLQIKQYEDMKAKGLILGEKGE